MFKVLFTVSFAKLSSMWKKYRRRLEVDQISSIFSSTDQSTSCCAKQLTRISGGSFISPPTQKRRGHYMRLSTFPAIDSQARRSLISLSADLLSPHPFYFLPWPSISWKLNYSAIVSVGHRVTSTLIRFHQQFFALAMLYGFECVVIHSPHTFKQLQSTEFTRRVFLPDCSKLIFFRSLMLGAKIQRIPFLLFLWRIAMETLMFFKYQLFSGIIGC